MRDRRLTEDASGSTQKSAALPSLREGEESGLTVRGLQARTTTRAGATERRAPQGPGEGDLAGPEMAAPARERGVADTRSDEADDGGGRRSSRGLLEGDGDGAEQQGRLGTLGWDNFPRLRMHACELVVDNPNGAMATVTET
jgi:hypothetical protein